jgi:hypothetical protein
MLLIKKHTHTLTNGCRWYLGEGIPLQPSIKTEKLELDAKTNAQVHAFFFFILIHNKFNTH